MVLQAMMKTIRPRDVAECIAVDEVLPDDLHIVSFAEEP